MNFLKINNELNFDEVYINLDHISYIHVESKTIIFSNGIKMHPTKKDMLEICKRLDIYVPISIEMKL